jgi:hypothetical protein
MDADELDFLDNYDACVSHEVHKRIKDYNSLVAMVIDEKSKNDEVRVQLRVASSEIKEERRKLVAYKQKLQDYGIKLREVEQQQAARQTMLDDRERRLKIAEEAFLRN